jgi:hypothetical protein
MSAIDALDPQTANAASMIKGVLLRLMLASSFGRLVPEHPQTLRLASAMARSDTIEAIPATSN